MRKIFITQDYHVKTSKFINNLTWKQVSSKNVANAIMLAFDNLDSTTVRVHVSHLPVAFLSFVSSSLMLQ